MADILPPRDIEDWRDYVIENPQDAIQAIRDGRQEVVLIPKTQATLARVNATIELDLPYMFKWYNNAVTLQYHVRDPTLAEILRPHQHLAELKQTFLGRNRGVPGLTKGMVNYYASHTHDLHLMDANLDQVITYMTGTEQWQVHPNRWRLNLNHIPLNRLTKPQQLHIEGPFVGTAQASQTDLSIIVPVSEQRSFIFWEGTATDPSIRADIRQWYLNSNGLTQNFAQPTGTEPWLSHQNGQTRRRRIVWPGTHMLLFVEAVAHEIDLSIPSSGIFISPYNPVTYAEEAAEAARAYEGVRDRKAALRVDRRLKEQNRAALTFHRPLRFRSNQERDNFDPPIFLDDLTRRETEIIGSLFFETGVIWPSGKHVFRLNHPQANRAFWPRYRGKYQIPSRTGKSTGNVRYYFPDYIIFHHSRGESGFNVWLDEAQRRFMADDISAASIDWYNNNILPDGTRVARMFDGITPKLWHRMLHTTYTPFTRNRFPKLDLLTRYGYDTRVHTDANHERTTEERDRLRVAYRRGYTTEYLPDLRNQRNQVAVGAPSSMQPTTTGSSSTAGEVGTNINDGNGGSNNNSRKRPRDDSGDDSSDDSSDDDNSGIKRRRYDDDDTVRESFDDWFRRHGSEVEIVNMGSVTPVVDIADPPRAVTPDIIDLTN